jgi:hypothetical protein
MQTWYLEATLQRLDLEVFGGAKYKDLCRLNMGLKRQIVVCLLIREVMA